MTDENLPKKSICYRSLEEQMIEFLKRESWTVFAI